MSRDLSPEDIEEIAYGRSGSPTEPSPTRDEFVTVECSACGFKHAHRPESEAPASSPQPDIDVDWRDLAYRTTNALENALYARSMKAADAEPIWRGVRAMREKWGALHERLAGPLPSEPPRDPEPER